MKMISVAFAGSVGLFLMIAGCGTAEYDWNKALAANTPAAYQAFLKSHGDSKNAANARGRLLAFEDDHAWSQAQLLGTIDGYKGYLSVEAGGIHAADAKYEITALERAQAWKSLPPSASAESLQEFLLKYPQGAESNEARRKLAELDYRVQVAVAPSQTAADRRRGQIQARFGKWVHGLVVVAPESGHGTYQVTSAPMSGAEAKSTCELLVRSHQRCKPIQSEGPAG
jgi:hypothetical protein